MSFFTSENLDKARALLEIYPDKRSALIPLSHLAQSQQGHLTQEAMEEIASLLDIEASEVLGTVSFYDMLHTEEVGRYLVGVCTNVACLLRGGLDLLDHAADVLGVPPGETTPDGLFTLEEVECVAHCDKAPCVQVNYRFFGPLGDDGFDQLLEDLRNGVHADSVPAHGTLSRVFRETPPLVSSDVIIRERAEMDRQKLERAEISKKDAEGAR